LSIAAIALVFGCAVAPPQQQSDPVEVRLTQQLEDQAVDLMQPFANLPNREADGARVVATNLEERVASGVPDAAESARLRPAFLKMAAASDAAGFAIGAGGLCYPDNKSAEAETVGRTLLENAGAIKKSVGAIVRDGKLPETDPDMVALLASAERDKVSGEVLVNVPTFCAQVSAYREAMILREDDKQIHQEALLNAYSASLASSPAPAIVVSPAAQTFVPAPPVPAVMQPGYVSPFNAADQFYPSPPIQVPAAAALP
jgi:hypothetical protein